MWEIQLKMTWEQRIAISPRLGICLRGRNAKSLLSLWLTEEWGLFSLDAYAPPVRPEETLGMERGAGKRVLRIPEKKKRLWANGSWPSKRFGRGDRVVGWGEGGLARSGGHKT